MREDVIRIQLEQMLGTQLRAELWNYFIDEGSIEKVMKGELTLSQLEDKVRVLHQAFGQPLEPAHAVPMLSSEDIAQALKGDSPRQAILSRLLAIEAEKEIQVQEFRASMMGGTLIQWEEVHQWIRIQSLRDGPLPTWYYPETRIPSEYQEEFIDAPRGREPLLVFPPIAPEVVSKNFRFRELKYGVPAGSWPMRSVPIVEGKLLDQLRILSDYLAGKYGWTEEQATTFVLTGLTPFVSNLTGIIVPNEVPAVARIQLTIDPTLSPEEVAEFYRKFRQSLVGLRHRELSHKHLMLALFAATRPESESWTERMAAWNREHPEWAYQQEGNFGRDCRHAQRRLLYPNYQIQLGSEEDKGEDSER